MSEVEVWQALFLVATVASLIALAVAVVFWRARQDEEMLRRFWEARAELYRSMWKAADEVLFHVIQAKASQEDDDPADYWKRGGKPFGEE